MSRESSPKGPSPAAANAPTAGQTRELLGTCFTTINAYMEGEMSVHVEEWKFVEQCNEVLRQRYGRLGERADTIAEAVKDTQAQLDLLPTYFSKVDDLERNLEALETVARGLDEYTKALEARFP